MSAGRNKPPYDPRRDIPDGANGDDRWPGGQNGESQVRTRGAPSFWDGAIGEKRRQEGVLCIGDGLNLEDTADILGCTYECLRAHIKDSTEFSAAIKRARAMFKRRALGKIIAGEDKWQSQAWLLERKYRGEYSPPSVVTPTAEDESRHIKVRDIERRRAQAEATSN